MEQDGIPAFIAVFINAAIVLAAVIAGSVLTAVLVVAFSG